MLLESPYLELVEAEFQVDRLPPRVRAQFAKGRAAWRDALSDLIAAGVKNAKDLADLVFFMHHPERVTGGRGSLLKPDENAFVKLRAEWDLYHTIARRKLSPAAACSVFLPANRSSRYEDYLAAPTTGRVSYLLNGRNQSETGKKREVGEAFDSMQAAVEALGAGDSLYLASWQFKPSSFALTGPKSAGMQHWGDLLVAKARAGVRIRIILTDFPEEGLGFKSDLADLDKLVGALSARMADQLQYIVSLHPATLPNPRKRFKSVPVATHHQKFMVLKRGALTTAYCGGIDISPPRSPAHWDPAGFIWHDLHAKLEGRIARDLEREFVLRWNREKDTSTAAKRPAWSGLSSLAQGPISAADCAADRNRHKLQMTRTVSVGATPGGIRRDDIWQSYFKLIGCASRFLFLENQYFREPALADAIVRQSEAERELAVLVVVSATTDDPDNELTDHGRALQHDFFTRLANGIPASRLRVYAMHRRLVHSKLILADDRALSLGSANANPRGFFLDSELNVTVDDPESVKSLRHRLWSHDLGVPESRVATWAVPAFIPEWDAIAKANAALLSTPARMSGEAVVPFDHSKVKGVKTLIPDVLTEA